MSVISQDCIRPSCQPKASDRWAERPARSSGCRGAPEFLVFRPLSAASEKPCPCRLVNEISHGSSANDQLLITS